MNLKKTLFTSIASVTLLSAGEAVVSQNATSEVVEAKTVTKKLSRNSIIYKANGKRAGKKTLKKGKKVNIYGYKKIHGKSYARIGKDEYVKTSNLAAIKKAKPAKKHTVKKRTPKKTTSKKKTPAKRTPKKPAVNKAKPVDPNKAMYKQWIKDCESDKGNLVAIRDTHEYDTSDDYDAEAETYTNIHAGEPYDIGTKQSHDEDDDMGIDVEKFHNEYYIIDNGGDGSIGVKASDFTYKPYDAQYSELKSELKKNTKGHKVKATLNKDVTSWDTNKKLSAGMTVTLKDPAIMIGNDGYYISCGVGEGDYMIPYSAISQLG